MDAECPGRREVAVHRSQQRRDPFQGNLGARAPHEDAPAELPVRIDVVDLEGEHRLVHRGLLFASFDAQHDVVSCEGEVDWHGEGSEVIDVHESPNARASKQIEALVRREMFKLALCHNLILRRAHRWRHGRRSHLRGCHNRSALQGSTSRAEAHASADLCVIDGGIAHPTGSSGVQSDARASEAGVLSGVASRSATKQASSMPVEVEFISALEAPPAVVWDRVVRVTGANDELWPLAKMTRPSVVDRLTAPGHGGLPPFRSWFLLFGVVPIDRRTMEFEVLEEGRFVESSTSWLNGRARHERTAIAGVGGSTVLTDRLVIESRGMLVDALIRASVTKTFRRRHRRLRRHFQKADRAPEL